MQLFFCTWPNDASFMVHAVDKEKAAAAAAEEVGSAPSKVRAFPPGVFGARVYFDEDDQGEELLTIEALPHVAVLLGALEDEADNEADVPAPVPPCMAEAETDDGAVVHCELGAHGAEVKHKSGELVW